MPANLLLVAMFVTTLLIKSTGAIFLLVAVWAAVLTALYGCLLGVIMDLIMERTGLDLRSRKIVEH